MNREGSPSLVLWNVLHGRPSMLAIKGVKMCFLLIAQLARMVMIVVKIIIMHFLCNLQINCPNHVAVHAFCDSRHALSHLEFDIG